MTSSEMIPLRKRDYKPAVLSVPSRVMTPVDAWAQNNTAAGSIQFFFDDEQKPVTLERLWAIAHQQTHATNQPAQNAFLAIGLRLENINEPWQYYCTPKNVKTFASTGRDGVHYSFLHSDSSPRTLSKSPVVMTVPMNFDNQNIVIAENLYEFLCLGCRVGYGNLEVLAENSTEGIEAAFDALISNAYLRLLSKQQKVCLQLLNNTFALSPVLELKGRMRRLQSVYLSQLQMGELESVEKRPQLNSLSTKPQRPAYMPFMWLHR